MNHRRRRHRAGRGPDAASALRRLAASIVVALAGIALSGAAAQQAGHGGTHARAVVEAIDLPAPPGSAQPQLFAAADGSLLLSWLEPGGEGLTSFRVARYDTGRWSEPSTISEGADFFINWADVPSVVQLRGGRLAAHWLQKIGPDTYAYDVKLRTSDDGGRTWSATITPHRDGTRTEHGFASLFDAPDGALGLVWLDGRDMKSGHDAHGAGAGAMTLRYTTLGADGHLGAEALLDDRVCECCPTSAVRTSRGILVAYRNRAEGEIRDIFVTRLEGGRWTTGVAVHRDNWQMPACPVNGPSLAAEGDRVSLAWFTAESDAPRVMLARSNDGGATWGRPVRVDEGVPLGRIGTVMLPDGAVLVGWIEFRDDGSRFLARRVGPDGAVGPAFTVSDISSERASGYPRLALSGERVYFAWTETKPVRRVRVAVLQ